MISAVSNHGAAISANRIISTAEMAKLGAITQFGPSAAPNVDSNSSKSSAVNPVVPTTAWIPCMPSHGSVFRAAPATVKSTTASHRASANAWRCSSTVTPEIDSPAPPGSTPATKTRSGSAATAAQMVRPIRPATPLTPILIRSVWPIHPAGM